MPTHLETIQMVQKLGYRLDPADYDRVEVVVCPPFTALRSVQTVIEADYLRFAWALRTSIGRERCIHRRGLSRDARQARRQYVIVGHTERRELFGEDDEDVTRKLRAVLDAGMTPILCCGETQEEREAGVTEDEVGSQVGGGLAGLDSDRWPGWSWPTSRSGRSAPAGRHDDDAAAPWRLRPRRPLPTSPVDAADSTRILYGGSVNPGNVAGLMAKKDIDGGLVGGASLDPDTFASLVRYWV